LGLRLTKTLIAPLGSLMMKYKLKQKNRRTNPNIRKLNIIELNWIIAEEEVQLFIFLTDCTMYFLEE
jgi:hypothetical protein